MIIENKNVAKLGSSRDLLEGSDAPHSPSGSSTNLHRASKGLRKCKGNSAKAAPVEATATSARSEDSEQRFDFVKTFEIYPEWLRKGPWSPLTYAYIAAFFGVLVWGFPVARELSHTVSPETPTAALTWFRVACGFWGLGFCAYMIKQGWGWAFSSYTVWSWTLASIYFAAAALRDLAGGQLSEAASAVANAARFPALVQVSVTVTLWWLVLFPMISMMLPTKHKMGFVKFNFGFIMLNIHGFVFPAILADLYLSKTALTPLDLWASFAVAFVYIVWYLGFLDRNGIHMYIFLSPRPHFSPLIYTAILCLYAACYASFNQSIGANTVILGFDTARLIPSLPTWSAT